MLSQLLTERQLPPLKSREEMKEILQREVYGYLPNVPFSVSVSEPKVLESRYDCGQVAYSYVNMTVTIGENSHTFRIDRLLHTDGNKRPLVILNNFHPMAASHYFPIEEMSEYNVDFLLFRYTDVSSDDGDFSTGLAPMLLPNGQDTDTTCGKIGIWAWAAMRVMDYALTLPSTDPDNVAIAGHSRLGKTALYTAMMDERFRFVFSNAAGCAGDSIAHGSTGKLKEDIPASLRQRGETIRDIVKLFSYWFCKNYYNYTEPNLSEEFDQHSLLATVAPRFVLIGSCGLDFWADPDSQQLCCLAAAEMWEKQGLTGMADTEDFLNAGECLLDGHVGFFKIHSQHFLSRHSWRRCMEFIEKHKA